MIRGKVAFGLAGQERYHKALDFDFVMGESWGWDVILWWVFKKYYYWIGIFICNRNQEIIFSF